MKILIPIKEAADILNVTIRAIQIKCKKQGISKIGNQYQITNDVLNDWIKEQETKSETKSETKQKIKATSQPKQKNHRFAASQIVVFILMIILIFIIYVVYQRLNAEISYLRQQNKENSKMYDLETKATQKRLNDAFDVIHNQDLEIQYLKIKDSITAKKIKL